MSSARLQELWAAPAVRAAVAGLLVFVGAECGQALTFTGEDRTCVVFWPPAGIILALLTLTAYRAWPALLLAACGASLASHVLVHQHTLVAGLGFCAAGCLEAALGAWLLRRCLGMPTPTTRAEHFLAFAGLAGLLSAFLGAILGASVLYLAYGSSYGPTWRMWWAADALGVLVVAPLLFARPTGVLRPTAWRWLEGGAVFLGLLVVAEVIYGDWVPLSFAVPSFVLPFLFWAGLRFGPRGIAAAVVMVAVVGAWNIARGHGPYRTLDGTIQEHLLRAQSALVVVCLSVGVLETLLAERRRTEQQRLRLIHQLEQALAEIRTLQGLIPICAWCKKLRDDTGSWQRLEDYLCAHTDATPTHGICPECLHKQASAVEALSAKRAR